MKKKKIIIIISAAVAALLLASVIIFVACSDSKDKENETADSTSLGTLEGTEHLAGNVTFPDSESETYVPTDPPTEEITELATESLTEQVTETETESVTEKETEPPTSLKYYSYGNGTCAVSGIGTYKEVYVIIPERSPSGDIVIAIDDKAFCDNTNIKAVSIPSTVMSIGNAAFSGCSSLVYVSVSENNMVFCETDGILYSKDKTKLILFPPANPVSEIFISVNVTEIADLAFASSPTLKHINYGGTLKDWGNIKIGAGNYGLYSAAMTFAITQ